LADAYRLDELARRVGGTVDGDGSREIRGVATLDRADPAELSFLTNPRYRDAALSTRAGAVLVGPGVELEGRDLLVVEEPYLALARLLELFHPAGPQPPGLSELAHVGRDVRLGEGVRVEPFAVLGDRAVLQDGVRVGAGSVVGEDSVVGEGTELKPQVVLYAGTRVGRRCLIHSGVVLGGDGYGFATSGGKHHKVPQLGRVVVEDDVEIGANTTVDRGTLEETVIGAGSKLDNLVMIAHGVKLGRDTLLAAQAGIAGSTRVGDGTIWAGQSGAAGHLEIAGGTVVAAKSAVLQSIAERSFVAGIPAVEHRRWKRSQAELGRLSELRRRVREFRARLDALEARLGQEED
jgi:UDP-3-O-[3-hydroxymyristoyl] glucosamine N-acyltransferase